MTSWTWGQGAFNPLGQLALGSAICSFGTGQLVPSSVDSAVFENSNLLWAFYTGKIGEGVVVNVSGAFVDCCSSSVSGAWVIGAAGPLVSEGPTGAQTIYGTPAGAFLEGVRLYAGSPIYVDVSGVVYNQAGSGFVAFNGRPVGFDYLGSTKMVAALPLYASGAMLGTLTLATSAVALTPLPSPVANATMCHGQTNGTQVAVGGWAPTVLASGFTTIAPDPFLATQFAGAGNGFASVWASTATAPNFWTMQTALSGVTAHPTASAWTANGTQILLADQVAGVIQILNYSAGVLSIGQTLNVPGAQGLALASTSQNALVANGSALVPLAYTSSWATGAAISLPGAACVTALTGTELVAGYGSGIAYYRFQAGSWLASGTVLTGFPVSRVTFDATGNIYAAGGNQFAVIQGSGVVGLITNVTGPGFTFGVSSFGNAPFGNATITLPTIGDIFAYNSQVVLTDTATNLLRVFGSPYAASGWSLQNSYPLVASGINLKQIGQTVFSFASGGTSLYNFGAPYALKQNRTGACSVYTVSSTTWNTFTIAPDDVPVAAAFTPSSGLQVATALNNLYNFGVNANLLASGIVPQYPGQPQNVPLGVTGMLSQGSSLYVSTCMAGSLIEIF